MRMIVFLLPDRTNQNCPACRAISFGVIIATSNPDKGIRQDLNRV